MLFCYELIFFVTKQPSLQGSTALLGLQSPKLNLILETKSNQNLCEVNGTHLEEEEEIYYYLFIWFLVASHHPALPHLA